MDPNQYSQNQQPQLATQQQSPIPATTPAPTPPGDPFVVPGGFGQPQPKSPKKKIIIVGIALLVIVVGLIIFFVTKSNGDTSPQTSSDTESAVQESLAKDDGVASDTQEGDATSSEVPEKAVHKTNAVLEDLVIGGSTKATEVVVNPFENTHDSGNKGDVVVLVKYEVHPSTKYYSSIYSSSVKLVDASGKGNFAVTSVYASEMKSGGYKAAPYSVSSGETGEGYEAYRVSPDQVATLSIQYKRSATKTSSGTIPEKIFEAKLY